MNLGVGRSQQVAHHRMYEFGPFRYDPDQKVLFREGAVVALVPKAVDTLQALLERRGRVVDKAELMNLVWPDTQVEDIGLARNISLLRKALGDDAETYIQTVPKRGYRFVSESGIPSRPAQPPASENLHRRWFGIRAVIAVGILLMLGALVYWQFYWPSPYLPRSGRFASLAVVPFEKIGSGSGSDDFMDGLNALLPAKLAKLDRVQVISPSTVRRYQQARLSMALMSRLIGLDVLVEGTVQRVGGKLRVAWRLADVHTGKIIWAEDYDYLDSDPSGAQSAAAQSIAAEVNAHLMIRDSFQR